MHEGNPIIGTARWAALIRLAAIVLFSTVLPYGAFAAQQAGGKAAAPASEEATQPKIHEFVTLLADPKIQQWLKEQDQAKATTGSRLDSAEMSMSHYLDGRLGAIREHIARFDDAIIWFEKSSGRGLPHLHSRLASAYALKGETERAIAELAEARTLSYDERYSSIDRLKVSGYRAAPKIQALLEATYFAGLRKAGMPEE